MPIGLVADDDFQRELDRLSGRSAHSAKPEIVEQDRAGRKEGDNNVPESLRKVIAEDALLNGRDSALSLARDFGISPSSVSAYTKGATSTTTYNSPNKSLISHINKSRDRAVKRAQKTLNGALNAITQDKLDYADPKDLASIAKDMTTVIRNLEPSSPDPSTQVNNQSVQFVIYAPPFKREDAFETVIVNE